MNEEKPFTYDYLDLDVASDKAALYDDCYRSFGWTNVAQEAGIVKTKLKLKRNRKIENKAQLTALQGRCESALTKIDGLERAKTAAASGFSIASGTVGTVLTAGATFAYLAGMFALTGVLGGFGLLLWAASPLIYRALKQKNTNRAKPLIEREYDAVCGICEEAAALLH